MFDLQEWLRRSPQPGKLRVKTQEGEERTIDLPKGRKRWHLIAETVRTSGATSVQALALDGSILRGKDLSEEDLDGDTSASDFAAREEKTVNKAMLAQAQMLDRYGARLSEAFAAGAEAASGSQDKLVALVHVLTQHLTVAITNLSNMSVNLSNAIQAAGQEGGEGGNQLMQGIMALVAAGAQQRVVTVPETPKNGAKKP